MNFALNNFTMKRIKNKGKMIKMQENKNLNIDNEKKFFYKTYEYKSKKALKIFFGFTREKGKNSFEIAKYLEKDFPELNFMKITEYKVIKYTPLHIKIETVSENINKTFKGDFISYYNYLVEKDDFELAYKTVDLWLDFETKFFEKGYYHMDFSLGNFFIDRNSGKIAFIDFDDIVRKPPFFRKRLFLTKSIRSFEGSMKFFLSVKNFSREENQKIIDKLEEIKKKYGVASREKDLKQTEKILNR